ncbi:LysM peptidoglycan-binding domain-containing C40 family peptidase [Streptomyces sp. BK022]|uniref:C40 family peptidase n=1 Tax=Streptomyces sp. BK022 TaxID=2512123 RepID=UPI0013EF59DF|nr:LysM peptidoglycan-binding domain-containing C40 family peptidase [Streptomyces sp. BK022]
MTVKSGQTLSGIASAHRTTYQHLASINHISNPSRIYPGERIYLTAGSAPAPAKPKPKPTSSTSSGTRIVNQAAKYIGTPYVWGGSSTKGMDCSGLTYATFKALGKSLPRVASSQYHASKKVSSPQKGDLVFVHDGSGSVYHVAIYVNSTTWLESEHPGAGVNYYHPWSKSVYYGRIAV